MLNLFIGNLMKYSAESENSPFHHLYLSSLNSKQINDGLVIRIIHSLDKTENRFSQPILDLPFLALTRDQGFFKDNIVVQCTESRNIIKTSQMLNCQGNDNAILHIKPLLKTSRDFIERLDKTFWSYFLDLEKFLKKKGTTLTRQNSEVITFRDTSIAKGKRSTFEKLFSMDNIEEDTRDDSSQVYVLFARKKNLRKHLAKHFDIVEPENNLKNFLILKIDQLSLTINSFSSFLTVKTVMIYLIFPFIYFSIGI